MIMKTKHVSSLHTAHGLLFSSCGGLVSCAHVLMGRYPNQNQQKSTKNTKKFLKYQEIPQKEKNTTKKY